MTIPETSRLSVVKDENPQAGHLVSLGRAFVTSLFAYLLLVLALALAVRMLQARVAMLEFQVGQINVPLLFAAMTAAVASSALGTWEGSTSGRKRLLAGVGGAGGPVLPLVWAPGSLGGG